MSERNTMAAIMQITETFWVDPSLISGVSLDENKKVLLGYHDGSVFSLPDQLSLNEFKTLAERIAVNQLAGQEV